MGTPASAEAGGYSPLSDLGKTAMAGIEGAGDLLSGHADTAIGHLEDMTVDAADTALNLATGGKAAAVEAPADQALGAAGLPGVHDLAKDGIDAVAKAGGDLLGDGLSSLVGDAQSHKAAVDFDDGNILAGVGDMGAGLLSTVGGALGGTPADAATPTEPEPDPEPQPDYGAELG